MIDWDLAMSVAMGVLVAQSVVEIVKWLLSPE